MDTTQIQLSSARKAGLVAALVMVAVQLGWRVLFSENNVVQALPEFIATAIARMTPTSLFGTITENYGSWAKRTLLVACCLGIIAMGPVAGQSAARLCSWSFSSFIHRLAAGLAVAAGLLGFILVVIMPLANLGMFARDSSYQSDIISQLLVTFVIWAVVWALLADDGVPSESLSTGEAAVSRRSAFGSVGGGALAIGSLGIIVWSLLDMFRAPKLSEEEKLAQEEAVDEIVSGQRADQSASPVAASPEALSGQALFDQLDASGELTPILTTTKDFYHVSKNFTDPTVSADGWTLEITGLVDKPLTFTHEELVARATTKQITTLCCISNELNGDLIGTAEWTGIPLVDLLTEAGVQASAIDLKCSAADDYTDSFPVSIGMDPHVLLVTGMNGEPLPDDHGFPARLIVPPIYGMKNLKWLQKIEAVAEDYQGYWQERGWSDTARYQNWARIDEPTGKIPPGPTTACGVASAGDRGVSRVEISLDKGETFADAELETPLNAPLTWVRWAYQFDAEPGRYNMRVRVTDGLGEVMDEGFQPPLPDGTRGWPGRVIPVG